MKLHKGLVLVFLTTMAGCSVPSESPKNPTEQAKLGHKALLANINTDPFEDPQDSASAINSPDAYAWKLFIAVNWPADISKRAADPSKKLGEHGPVVWETWENARDVYPLDGSDPGPWTTSMKLQMTDGNLVRSATEFDALPIQQQIRQAHGGPSVKFDPVAAKRQINETRLNRVAYEFVRDNGLYNLDGQQKFASTGQAGLQFPLLAKETKAQWRVIGEADKPRYHWTEVTEANGTKVIYGLTALHITTKDLPNWFWATFEHVDNPTRPGNEKWLLPSRDTFACNGNPSNCNVAPTGIGLEGTVWENYRLRGTQVDFTTPQGVPTLLANSQPEEGFQKTSSCITCHSRATIATDGSRLEIFKPNGDGDIGTPDPSWFAPGGKQKFAQLDFVWSMARAKPKKAS